MRPTYGATSRDVDEPKTQPKSIVPQTDKKNYFLQGLLGVGEILGGVAVFVGSVYSGYYIETKGILTYSTGQTILTGMTIGSAFIADGIQLLTSAIQKEEKKSILPVVLAAIIVDPMVDVGIGLSDFRYSKREDK